MGAINTLCTTQPLHNALVPEASDIQLDPHLRVVYEFLEAVHKVGAVEGVSTNAHLPQCTHMLGTSTFVALALHHGCTPVPNAATETGRWCTYDCRLPKPCLRGLIHRLQ
jgi:hypothetical protein